MLHKWMWLYNQDHLGVIYTQPSYSIHSISACFLKRHYENWVSSAWERCNCNDNRESEANEGENCLHCLVTPLQQNLPLILQHQDDTHTSWEQMGGYSEVCVCVCVNALSAVSCSLYLKIKGLQHKPWIESGRVKWGKVCHFRLKYKVHMCWWVKTD